MNRPDPDDARASALAEELRAVLGRLKRRLREQAAPGDLTWSQVRVLGRLERHGPSTVTDLARAEGMRPQSMGAVVRALEEAGLLSGAPDPRDARRTILAITDSCREWILAGRAARQDWLCAAIRRHLAPAEQDTLASAAALLRRLVGSDPA